jgi:hypothetical protein
VRRANSSSAERFSARRQGNRQRRGRLHRVEVLRRIRVRHRDALDASAGDVEIDEAPVGEMLHDEDADRFEDRAILE